MEIPRANSPRVVAYNPRHPLNNATPNGQNKLVMREFRFLFLVYGYVYVYEKLLLSAFRHSPAGIRPPSTDFRHPLTDCYLLDFLGFE